MSYSKDLRACLKKQHSSLVAKVASFEREFAQFSGVKHCVGVANGTDALEMTLRAVSVGAGDEVIGPANSFVASAFAVIRAGAVLKFVDSDPDTHLIDVQAVARQITRRTKAILQVPLYGQMAPMEDLKSLADQAGAVTRCIPVRCDTPGCRAFFQLRADTA